MYNVLVLDKHCNSVVKLSDLTTLKFAGRPYTSSGWGDYWANGQNGILALVNEGKVELNLPKLQYMISSLTADDLTLYAPNLITLYYKLTKGYNGVTRFKGDLPNLMDGSSMFGGNLTSFIGTLPKLITGVGMFGGCKLNPQSVANILFSLRDINEVKAEKEVLDEQFSALVSKIVNLGYSQAEAEEQAESSIYPEIGWAKNGKFKIISPAIWSFGDASSGYQRINFKQYINYEHVGKLTIGINVSPSVVDGKDTVTQLLQFANEVGFDTWADLKQAFVEKGWDVTFQYNDRYGSTITYDLRNGEREIPLPIYATLIECENKEMAEYCNEDGSKFYNIEWGHDVTNPEKFQQFDSIEDAAASYGVFRKDFLEENS